ncbi:polyisoprenoid-binding protein [Streptomyces triticagri]|uniref:Polyisoprenoid-binding protein n=1 Tax=Streptomyces triticagri TaxID=2293568 RepID=A0A372MAY7_9ACTN|nr:YceI family protein [Streptomyces triticagri]RFU88112.1 polyisoprenoid-binding protein [Streptomyces triticagri]
MTTTESRSTTDALPLPAGRWGFDPFHSAVGFTIRHLGISKVRGRFNDLEAELVVGETLATSSVSATVDLASVDTGNTDRDAHVRSPDLLDVARRPTMTFRSTRIDGDGEDWTLEGDLTIGGVTRQVTFDVEFGGLVDVPMDGSRHAGFDARGEIRRSEFGLDFAPGLLGDVIRIDLDVQFVAPKAEEAAGTDAS